jgi:peroxiredoxin (alkyl hydroperoxide reductase subunit C)
MLSIGTAAPDFELPQQNWGTTVRLSEFRGKKNVVLAFHPLNFTPVCSTQMKNYEASKADFDAVDAKVLSISCDAGPSQKAWADALGLSFDLLADFHPKGAVAEAYGVMRADGIPERAIFVVDKKGTIAWAAKYDIPEQPPLQDLLSALKSLT